MASSMVSNRVYILKDGKTEWQNRQGRSIAELEIEKEEGYSQ